MQRRVHRGTQKSNKFCFVLLSFRTCLARRNRRYPPRLCVRVCARELGRLIACSRFPCTMLHKKNGLIACSSALLLCKGLARTCKAVLPSRDASLCIQLCMRSNATVQSARERNRVFYRYTCRAAALLYATIGCRGAKLSVHTVEYGTMFLEASRFRGFAGVWS